MSTHDQLFQTTAPYQTSGKPYYIYYADTEEYPGNGGYINNSLEGTIFDSSDGSVVLDGIAFYPKFKFFDTSTNNQSIITSISVTNNICTMTCSGGHTFSVGDVVAITGVDWDSTHPFVNGVWMIDSVDGNDFSYDLLVDYGNSSITGFSFGGMGAIAISGSVLEIMDDRSQSDPRGLSFTSTLLTPARIIDGGSTSKKRVLPSDLYVRFRFQTGSDTSPQGGINSNLFSVVNDANINIKPMLWAYFFGYSTSSLPAGATAFHVAFNSYAIVLRPTGDGARLEFALLKFNWGTINDGGPTGEWMSNRIDNETNRFEIEGTDLGYLIATNPDVENSKVTELAISDSFTYDSEFTAKFNLKISIRKHLLSDSELDNTYLVNLLVNDTYDEFGPGKRYDSVLHGYISRPSPLSVTTSGSQANDLMLAPMLYFKFNNTNEQNVGVPNFSISPPNLGSSKIVLDNVFYRQLNSSTNTQYLY